ncbi:MAG: proP 1 [Bryobacterales bacterium]|jgi:MFS transporter, MHS family, shikimate and dehydroshikimate transport protein|nr:proP 1 [Bryobacterales bacterium]
MSEQNLVADASFAIPDGQRSKLSAVVGSSLIGTAIEFYDFFIYGTAAALVFPRVFFPTLSPYAGLMAAYATLAIPFLTRPLGAIVFGHYGDRIGRKSMLMASLTIMGLSTFAIGLVPSYDAIGLLAPTIIIILRLLQGFALGGEWGGAATMLVEYAPPEKRGFYGTFVQLGNVVGLFTSTLVFALLPQQSIAGDGWRWPFLISILMLAVGLYIRQKVDESPVFEAAVKNKPAARHAPIMEVLRNDKRPVLVAMGSRAGEIILGWIVIGFLLSYATRTVGLTSQHVLIALLTASGIGIVTVPLFGHLSDKIGRRPVFLFGATLGAIFAFPLFWLINTANPSLFILSIVIGYSIGLAAMFAVQPSFFAESFPTEIRYTGISLGFQLANIIGGLTPMIATFLAAQAGGASWPISLFLMTGCAVSVGCVLTMTESAGRKLT